MKPTLLIADGDAALRALFDVYLTECGYEVGTASDGVDCLEKLRRSPPNVLVLDRGLAWGGGDGVLAWLREERAASGLPVVLTVAAGRPADVEDPRPPVVRLLRKPFGLTTLLAAVNAAFAGRPGEEPFDRSGSMVWSEFFVG
jgi:DNA-binding response OmpR family regulator